MAGLIVSAQTRAAFLEHVARIAPQDGTYLPLVTDYTGTTSGCYRYRVDIS